MKLFSGLICVILIISTGNAQKIGRYTVEEWQTAIDTTWGEGLENNLQIFDRFWNTIDDDYASFHNLNVNWDSLKNVFRPEIEAGISRGRFFGIISYLNLVLNEAHTKVVDLGIYHSDLKPGIPLLVYHSGYYWNDHGYFGAGLSPLPDSTLLVYKVINDHPLGLKPGDIVLGYDGIPWKNLYKELLAAYFPITSQTEPFFSITGGIPFGGSSDRSATHLWLISAGLNWHLFDTIDIIKYGSNDTLHLQTSLLSDLDTQLICTEQLPVPGVPMPDLSQKNNLITWGVVDGTQIGYIYVSHWVEDFGADIAFANAVDKLLNDYQTEGLIIDSRLNAGGQFRAANDGFSRLFNFNLEVLDFAKRNDPDNHYTMSKVTDTDGCSGKRMRFNADHFLYDKPIAVLTGPLCWSAGDYNAMRLRFHPMTKFFGKPTNTAYTCFNSETNFLSEFNDWLGTYAPTNAFLIDSPDNYLIHVGFDVDEEVWLTQEDVVKGEDTVVKRAIEWIQNLAYAHDVTVDKTYIKAGIDSVGITATLQNPNQHNLSVEAVVRNMDSTITDNIDLFDDGMHGDGGANDNLWGNFYQPTGEQLYKISVTTNDNSEETSRTLQNVAWFTTIGPVVFDSYSITHILGRSFKLKLFLKNEGIIATASNITTEITTTDTSEIDIPIVDNNPTDIPAGQTVEIKQNFTVTIPGSHDTLHFDLNIYSDGYHFWNANFTIDSVTNINKKNANIPKSFSLLQNYPNPFNPSTKIKFALPKPESVKIEVYNLIGQRVETLLNKRMPAGYHEVEFTGQNLSSGIYMYRIEAGGWKDVKKMILLR